MKETKEVRKRVADDAVSQKYMQYARVRLGALKKRMELGNLQVLEDEVTLPEGVTILVSSIYGIDNISIYTIPSTKKTPETIIIEEEECEYFFVGAKIVSDTEEWGQRINMWVYEGGDNTEDLDNQILPAQNFTQYYNSPSEYPVYDRLNLSALAFGFAYTPKGLIAGSYIDDPIDTNDYWDVATFLDKDYETLIFGSGPNAKKIKSAGRYIIKLSLRAYECRFEADNKTIKQQLPTEVEIKIITGGVKTPRVHKETIYIESGTAYISHLTPGGYNNKNTPPEQECDTPVFDDGECYHGPHWWQGAVEINLGVQQKVGTAKTPEEEVAIRNMLENLPKYCSSKEIHPYYLPSWGFGSGGASLDQKCPKCGPEDYTREYYVSIGATGGILTYDLPWYIDWNHPCWGGIFDLPYHAQVKLYVASYGGNGYNTTNRPINPDTGQYIPLPDTVSLDLYIKDGTLQQEVILKDVVSVNMNARNVPGETYPAMHQTGESNITIIWFAMVQTGESSLGPGGRFFMDMGEYAKNKGIGGSGHASECMGYPIAPGNVSQFVGAQLGLPDVYRMEFSGLYKIDKNGSITKITREEFINKPPNTTYYTSSFHYFSY